MSYDELETERLKLRMWRESDLDDYAELTADPARHAVPAAWQAAVHASRRVAKHRVLHGTLADARIRPLGCRGESQRPDDWPDRFLNPEGWPGFEIGWTLARHAWGKGYATEGGRRALDTRSRNLDQRHVISLIHPENTPSMRVAERLGEKREGTARVNDIDVLVYGVDRP